MINREHDFRGLATRLVESIVRHGNEVVFGDKRITDDLLQGEALRYFTRVFAAGLVSQVEAHDADYPHFIKILSPWLNWGYPNPDGTYTYANVHGDYSYRIYGRRGTNRLFDIEVYKGDIYDMTHSSVSIGGRRHILGGKTDMHIEADGSFEVILSAEKQEGNWIPLPPGGDAYVHVRQWYYDYEKEMPGEFYIERIDAQFPRPALTAERHVANFERLIEFVDTVWAVMNKGIAGHYESAPDIVPFPTGLIGENAFRSQRYGRGRFTLAPDEAIIMELTPPKAEYWMFGLMSPFWEIYDWLGRQISINGHQAVIDDDGKFRVVIAHKDPGVYNWLDSGNHSHGLIAARYNWSEDVPIPTLKTVPFASLAEHLPKSTKRITPAERHEILRRRMLSQRRRQVDW